MLEKVKKNSLVKLMGTQIDTTAMENSMQVP